MAHGTSGDTHENEINMTPPFLVSGSETTH